MRVCLGGTFEPFHAGHEALLSAAAEDATDLFVGITEGRLSARPDRAVAPWAQRAAQVERFLRASGYRGSLVVRPLSDRFGPAAVEPFDRIVVSPETVPGALAINVQRAQSGLPPLAVKVVPHRLADDLLPISGTAIAAGLIDRHGRRLRPVRVAVGSANPVKLEAVRAEFARALPGPVEVTGYNAASGVPEQPQAAATLEGARNRAKEALAAAGSDYAVGIEAGLVRMPGETEWMDAQACVILDRTGWETRGWGPAFAYPAWVAQRALRGEMVSSILGPVAGDPRIGGTTGAIGWLTDGRMDRTQLTRAAVLMALVPRLRRSLYTAP